jgi:hypothetical protein
MAARGWRITSGPDSLDPRPSAAAAWWGSAPPPSRQDFIGQFVLDDLRQRNVGAPSWAASTNGRLTPPLPD